MLEDLKKEWKSQVAVILFIVLTSWWIALFLSGSKESFNNYLFGATYGVMAIWGGVWGAIAARKWGFTRSVIGRALVMLSLGLLCEEFGQLVFSYYNLFVHITIPYPSLADLGFFGVIPFYSYGVFLLAQASGIKFTLRTVMGKMQMIIIPLGMLAVSYVLFLNGYQFDFSNPLKIFLDFAYPLGDAIYISLAILTYSLSRRLLGGIMRNKVLFLIGAFVLQYAADFNFLYQNSKGNWINGGYGDYLYLVAYFTMALGLIQFKTVLAKLN